MSKRGPAKQPQHLLELKGTARKSRKRTMPVCGKLITTLEQVGELCDYSILSKQGQQIFLQRCTYLIGLKMLEAAYLDALLLYSMYFDMALQCIDEIQKEKWFSSLYDKKGKLAGYVENPHLKLLDRICRVLGNISKELLLTPASRMRMEVESEKKAADIMNISSDPIEI